MQINKLLCRRAFVGKYTVNYLIPCWAAATEDFGRKWDSN